MVKRLECPGHYSEVLKRPCTEVQVFHRKYRENEAKREAKVSEAVTVLFSIGYGGLASGIRTTRSWVWGQKCDFCTIAKLGPEGVKWYRSTEHELSDRSRI